MRSLSSRANGQIYIKVDLLEVFFYYQSMDNQNIAKENQKNSILEVPAQVFEKFLSELESTDVPKDVITRLRKTILEEGKLKQDAIQKAIFSED